MADKATKEIERIYTIPLRKTKSSPRNHRSDRAVWAVKTYLSKHMKSEEIWIDRSVNEKLWERGMYKIPSKIRVRALKFDDGVVEVTLPETDVTTSLRAELTKSREEREAKKSKKADESEEKAEEKPAAKTEEGSGKPAAKDEKPAAKEPALKADKKPAAEKPTPKAEKPAAKPAAQKAAPAKDATPASSPKKE